MKHPNLTPSMLTLVSLPQVLLRPSFLELSFTWSTAFVFERRCLQENIEKFWMLNKRRRWWHHSSRVNLVFVRNSARWFFGFYTFDLDFWWSKLILSNSQSDATLWVPDTCLISWTSTFDDHSDHRFVVFSKCTTALHIEVDLRL